MTYTDAEEGFKKINHIGRLNCSFCMATFTALSNWNCFKVIVPSPLDDFILFSKIISVFWNFVEGRHDFNRVTL